MKSGEIKRNQKKFEELKGIKRNWKRLDEIKGIRRNLTESEGIRRHQNKLNGS